MTIPISLIGAMAAMMAMGFSLNLLTLLAIVLSVGLVVDDAIVVVENVSRHMRDGMSRTQAALVSSRQLFAPIVAMTITLAAVYAPIGLLTGLTGVLFKEFAFTSGYRRDRVRHRGGDALADHERLYGTGRRATRAVTRASSIARWTAWQRPTGVCSTSSCLSAAPIITFAAFLGVLAAPLYMFSGKELAPVEDEGFILLIVNSAPDASLAYTSGHMDKVYAVGKALPEFDAMFEIVFPSTGFGGYLLKNWHDRERSAHADPARDLRRYLANQRTADLPGVAAAIAGCWKLRR